MQTRFEHFAIAGMLDQPDTPPRTNGSLCFAHPWEREAFGLAIALARDGHFEWQDFRNALIREINAWEAKHQPDDPNWDYYECWLTVLEGLVSTSQPNLSLPSQDG